MSIIQNFYALERFGGLCGAGIRRGKTLRTFMLEEPLYFPYFTGGKVIVEDKGTGVELQVD